MRVRIFNALCLLGMLVLASPLFARSFAERQTEIPPKVEAKPDSVVRLEEFVVTGTRTPKPLKDVPIETRVITKSDIEKRDAADVQELLQGELSGMEFTLSMNGQTTLDMQGFGGGSVLFLLDGQRLAGETLDNVDYSRIDLQSIERIEIVKGAASSFYGSNAVGGVINIITKKQREPWSVNLNGRYGAHNSQRYGGTLGLNKGIFTSLTTVQHSSVDEIDLRKEGQLLAGDITNISAEKTWNAKEQLTIRPTDKLVITARGGYFFRERYTSKQETDRYRDYSASLGADYWFSPWDKLEVSYSFDEYDKSDYSTITATDTRNYSNRQHIVRTLFNHNFTEKTVLSIGGDYLNDYLMSYQFAGGEAKSQHNLDGFVQADFAVTERLSAIAGLRFDYYSASKLKHLSPKAGLMYRLPHLTLRLSYSDGFRAPSLKEMFMVYDMAGIFMIYGNENLKSETSHNFRASAECNFGVHNLTLSGFHSAVLNRISTVWNNDLGGQSYVNMGRIAVSGLEAGYSAKLSCGLSLTASYSYTRERAIEGLDVGFSARPHALTFRIDYNKKWNERFNTNLALSSRMLSSLDCLEYTPFANDELISRHYPGYSLWKLTLSQRLFRAALLTLTLDNIFNYVPDYYYFKSPITTGRTLTVGLSLDLEKLF